MKYRWRITRAGGLAILIASVMITAGLVKTINLLVLLGYLLLGLVLVNALLARRALGLTVRIDPGQTYFAGSDSARVITLQNPTPQPVVVTLRDCSKAHSLQAAVIVPARETTTVRRLVRVGMRGVHPVSTSIGSNYPFGFMGVDEFCTDAHPLIVFPALGKIEPGRLERWLQRKSPHELPQRKASNQFTTQIADLRGVRSFRSGDSQRFIHWPTTARCGELMVREFDQPLTWNLELVIDPWLPGRPDSTQRKSLENLLSLAATIVDHWCSHCPQQKISVSLPQEPRICGRAASGFAIHVLTKLAAIEGSDAALTFPQTNRSTDRVARLLATTRPLHGKQSPLADIKMASYWQILSALHPPDWYHPPYATE